MALDCTASLSYVDHGSGASLDNLDAQTWLFWVNPQTITVTNKRILWKNSGTQGVQVVQGPFGGTQGRLNYNRNRATTSTTATAPNDTLTANEWQFLAVTDSDGVVPRIYRGTLSALVAEIGSYATQTTGSGAPLDEAGQNLFIGARNSANTESDCYMARVWVYNRVLTLGEIQAHQFAPGLFHLSGCVLHTIYGFNDGNGTQRDWSANGNHGTITGATVVTHPPLGALFPAQARRGPYAVAAAAASQPWDLAHTPQYQTLITL